MEEAFKRQDPRDLSTENGLHRCYKNEESKKIVTVQNHKKYSENKSRQKYIKSIQICNMQKSQIRYQFSNLL